MQKKQNNQRYLEIRRVTVIGAVIDLVLGIAKIIFGVFGHSHGLVADGVHSLSDLATDVLVVWAARHGTQEADEEHPYGHERIQTIATVLLGLALIVVGLGIAFNAVNRLLSAETLVAPSLATLAVASLSIIAKEWIYQFTMRVAHRIQSKLLKANAWHSRSDALSSVVVFIGIGGTMIGIDYLDVLAAVAVAAMIIHVGWRLGKDSVHELIDTGLDKKHLDNMRNTMLSVEDVKDIHQLRTRRMGHQVFADVHVIVAPDISVSEGHRISEEVERVLTEQLDEPTDVTVHIDTEEDQEAPPKYLPLRSELMPGLRDHWSEICDIQIQRATLHYLRGKIRIELFLFIDEINNTEIIRQYAEQLRQKYASEEQIETIDFVLLLR
ncbi:MAG: cation diffusion facilitator family transporter [Gammaproteobacteria bacterium]